MNELDVQLKKCSAKNRQKTCIETHLLCQNCLNKTSTSVIIDFSEHKTSDNKLVCPWCMSFDLKEVTCQ